MDLISIQVEIRYTGLNQFMEENGELQVPNFIRKCYI